MREVWRGNSAAWECDELGHLNVRAYLANQLDRSGRFGGYVPGVGNAPTLKDAAFALTEKAPVAPEAYEVGGDAVIAVLGNIIPAPEERLGSEKEAIEQRLRAQKEAQVVSDFIEELRDKSRVEIGQGYANLIDAEA